MLIRLRPSLPILICCAALLAGCGAQEHPCASPSPTEPLSNTTEHATTATAPAIPLGADSVGAGQALNAYRLMWHELQAAWATSNRYSTGLALHASGKALTELANILHTDSMAGVIRLGLPALSPRITAVRIPEVPIEVDIVDCVDVSQFRKHKARGGLADSTPNRQHVEATVRNNDDKWTVLTLSLREAKTC